jgi:hypothetical protein
MSEITFGPHDKIQYVLDPTYVNDGGVLVSVVDGEKVHIGWSFIHPTKEKNGFDREFGKKLAFNRAVSLTKRPGEIESKIPRRYLTEVIQFVWRCRRYYKDKMLPSWTTDIPTEPEREVVEETIPETQE